MANQVLIAVAFIAFLLLFTVVGIYSATRKQNTTTDYLLANRGVNSWLTAFSAMATGQSGLLFTGGVGFSYTIGISSIWLAIGWIAGDYIAWMFVCRRLREVTEATDSETVSAFLGQRSKRFDWISLVSALITIAFLGSYAAAQLVAGSKALNAVFGWNYNLGIVVGAVIVVVYCFSGGIRASIWTDTVQGVIMIGSLLLLVTVAVASCGGLAELWSQLNQIDPALTSLAPASLQFGFIPFFVGWLVAGFGVVGQPHILIRAMAIDSVKNVGRARDIKMICSLINSLAATGIGIAARVLLPELGTNGDPELSLLYLSMDLLPAVLVGLMLAGLFSATISTADSQVLSCSAALTQDIFPPAARSYTWVKLGTLTVTAIVLIIALSGNDSVFSLITFSWSALASALGPLLVVRTFQKPVSTPVAVAMMIVGIAVALTWNLQLRLSSAVYEVLPGMVASTVIYLIAQPLIATKSRADRFN